MLAKSVGGVLVDQRSLASRLSYKEADHDSDNDANNADGDECDVPRSISVCKSNSDLARDRFSDVDANIKHARFTSTSGNTKPSWKCVAPFTEEHIFLAHQVADQTYTQRLHWSLANAHPNPRQ